MEETPYIVDIPNNIISVNNMERYIEGLKNQIKYEPRDLGEVDIPKADPDLEGEGNG